MLFISELVNRSVDHLVMNQSENARRYNETKQLIDRTLPLVNYGKGRMLRPMLNYFVLLILLSFKGRFDSEFWNQSLMLGQPEDGIL